jgi:hypothetical protein
MARDAKKAAGHVLNRHQQAMASTKWIAAAGGGRSPLAMTAF